MKTMLMSGLMLLLLLATSQAQAQDYPLPSLEPFPKGDNRTHRTDVCRNFVDYATGKVAIRDALKDLSLTVGIVDQQNGRYINFTATDAIDKEKPGIFIVILNELARRGQFTWKNSYAFVKPPKDEINPETGLKYNWTDVLHEAVLNYDFTFAEWVHTQERRERGISFPTGWFDASTILVRYSEDDHFVFDVYAFLKPFSMEVWGMIVGVFIVSGLLYWMIDKIANWGTDNEVNSILYDMFLATMTFTQHHMYWDPSGHGKRIFAFSASFWSLVLASAYTANLASFLVSQGQTAETATDFSDVNQQKIPLCARANAAVESELKNKYKDLQLTTADDFDELIQSLRDGECDLLALRRFNFLEFQNSEDYNKDCSLQWVGRQEVSNKAGPATLVDTKNYCTSLITHVLDIHMNDMLDDNFIEKAWEEHLRAETDYHCGSKETESKDVDGQYSLTIKEVGGIFVFHAALGLVSILVALGEMWWKRRDERAMLQAAVNEGKEAPVEQRFVKPRASTNMPAAAHYQSSMALQSIISDRAGQRKSRPAGSPMAGRRSGGGAYGDDDVDFNEDVLGTIQSLQTEMEKLQNYVVEKRNKQNGEGMLGA